MKKAFTLKIDQPCSEKWEDFTPTSDGGFCQSCSKNVIDFSRMSEAEIIAFFQSKPTKVCGRFQSDQLKNYPIENSLPAKRRFSWLPVSLISLPLILVQNLASAKPIDLKPTTEQTDSNSPSSENTKASSSGLTIRGKVVDENGDALAGVAIYQKGTNHGAFADLEGNFELKELKTGDILIFSFIGYESQKYKIPNGSMSDLSIVMKMGVLLMAGEVSIDEPYTAKKTFWQSITQIFRK